MAGGSVSCCSYCGSQYGVSSKTENRSTMGPSWISSGVFSQRTPSPHATKPLAQPCFLLLCSLSPGHLAGCRHLLGCKSLEADISILWVKTRGPDNLSKELPQQAQCDSDRCREVLCLMGLTAHILTEIARERHTDGLWLQDSLQLLHVCSPICSYEVHIQGVDSFLLRMPQDLHAIGAELSPMHKDSPRKLFLE